ncbi:MAG: FAD binding domain-containing protein [Pseudomonadota bacterium]|nr:FAD binding domain-containing protein [Pseudomonadota bacterium]
MLLPEYNFHKPKTLDECLQVLSKIGDQGQLIAGGTDVVFNMRLRLFQPEHLVSIRSLEELQTIEELPDGALRIGAGCRLEDLSHHQVIQQKYPALKESIDAVASTHIRNLGTLGGNICLQTRCWFTNNSEEWRKGREGCFKTDCEHCHVIQTAHRCHAINNSDTPVALIALDATLTLAKAGETREVPIADFYRCDGEDFCILEPDEMVTAITLPAIQKSSVFLKFTPRRGMDFSLGAIAASANFFNGKVENVRLVLGSISSAPIDLVGPAKILEAEGLDDQAIEKILPLIRGEMGELTNLYGRAGYKKQIARSLVERAIIKLRELQNG